MPLSFKRWAVTAALLCGAAQASASDLAIVIHDISHAQLAPRPWLRVVHLQCSPNSSTCTAATASGTTDGTDHGSIVGRIIRNTLDFLGTNGRRVTIYSAVGSRSGLDAWLAAALPPPRSVIRARALGVRALVDTTGNLTLTHCDGTTTSDRATLKANGVALLHSSGNFFNNGICSNTRAVIHCDASTFNVTGYSPVREAECRPEAPVTNRPTTPLWDKANFLPGHVHYGASPFAEDWGAPSSQHPGTSWSAPAVAAGFLALAAQRAHPVWGSNLVDESAETLNRKTTTLNVIGGGSFQQVDAQIMQRAVAAQCTGMSYPESGFYWDPDHSGNGLYVQARNQWDIYWYTFRPDGTPVWYHAHQRDWNTNPRPSPRTWFNAALTEYRWENGAAVGTVVGSIALDFCQPSSVTIRWRIGAGACGTSTTRCGTEPMVRYKFGSGTRPIAVREMSGIWYDPTLDGAGYTIESRGAVDFLVYYFYDLQGRGTWGTAQFDVRQKRPSYWSDLLRFSSVQPGSQPRRIALCPGCDDPEGAAHGTVGGSVQYDPTLGPDEAYDAPVFIGPSIQSNVPTPANWPPPAFSGLREVRPL